MPHSKIPGFLRDLISAWEALANGFNPKTNTELHKYWNQWKKYTIATGINPFLDKSVPPDKRDIIAGAFAARFRTGSYGRGYHIKVSGVTDDLTDISKTIELVGQHSQLYREDHK